MLKLSWFLYLLSKYLGKCRLKLHWIYFACRSTAVLSYKSLDLGRNLILLAISYAGICAVLPGIWIFWLGPLLYLAPRAVVSDTAVVDTHARRFEIL